MTKEKLKDYAHLIPFGYAPGNYIGICGSCGKQIWSVDKRTVCCRDCAEIKYNAVPKQLDIFDEESAGC